MFNLMATTAVSLGGFNVAIVDLVALVVLLIFLIVGIVKGFFQQVLSLLGWVAAIVVAVLTCTYVANFLSNTFPDLVTTVNGWWGGLVNDTFSGVTDADSLRIALEESTIPVFLHESIITLVGDEFANISQTIINTLTDWCFIAVSFILIFILALILFKIIKGIFRALTELPVIKQIDKLLGAVLGLIKGLALLLVVSVILSMFPWFNEFLNPAIDGEAITCVFNNVFQAILSMPFIQDALSSISLA